MPQPGHLLPRSSVTPQAFAALLAPFAALTEDKRDILRGVLQIYVSKDAAQRTDLDKRHRVTSLINAYAKGEEAEE